MKRFAFILVMVGGFLRAGDGSSQGRVTDFGSADTSGSPGVNSGRHSYSTTIMAFTPTIAAYYPDTDDLFYEDRTSGSWIGEPIDVVGDVGRWPSLIHDSGGSPHVSYYDATNGRLKYARKPSTLWLPEAVDGGTGSNLGLYTSIAVSAIAVYISYYDATNGDLKVAARPLSGGPWTIETADASGDVGKHTSIVESGGLVAVSYYDATNGDLKFARRLMQGWVTETADAAGNVGLFTSLVQKGSDYAVSYYDIGYGRLKLATRVGGMWSTEVVDEAGNVGEYSSLVAGGPSVTDQLEIAYYDRTNADLKFARKLGLWNVETVDAPGDVGRGCSLSSSGSTAGDSVSVAYQDVTQPGLKFWTRKNPVVAVGDRVARGTAGARLWCSPGLGHAVRIHFRSATAGPVTISVHDITGRRLAHPVQRFVEPGEHVEEWGVGEHGVVAWGIYFVRMTGPDGKAQARALLLR